MSLRLIRAGCLAAACLAFPAMAHDFWIEPANYRPSPGDRVDLRLRVGDGFRGDALPRDPGHLERFFVVDSVGVREVPGRPESEPAGAFRVLEDGPLIVAYQGHPKYIELSAARFEAYLREEGLESILAERTRRGESGSPGRELFSRHAKSFLAPEGHERRLGLRLEIVPVGDSFEVVFDGEPLSDTRVSAIPASDPTAVRSARTDANGRVALSLDRPGAWLLTTVHMVRLPAGSAADWQSFWASLTFEQRGRVPKRGSGDRMKVDSGSHVHAEGLR